MKKLGIYFSLILLIYVGFDHLNLDNYSAKLVLGNAVLLLVTLGIIFLERPKKNNNLAAVKK